jgi:prepilin-type N-terminal cleavage/methylation domain-containing protein
MVWPQRSAGGFTLVELLAVLVILALLSAAGATLALGAGSGLRMQDLAERIGSVDSAMRLEATRSGRAMLLLVDLDHGRLAVLDAVSQERVGRVLDLPHAVRIEAVKVGSDTSLTHGSVLIPCSAMGYTPSYGLQLGAGVDRRRLVVLGLTGQQVEVGDERQLDQILSPQPQAAGGHDAR